MPFIYKITNNINGKIYVGKTNLSVEARFRQHCKDSSRPRCEKRPLYSAMQKYGTAAFSVETLEETDSPDEREVYWIEKLGSFKYGYNATLGGDGKRYADYDLIASLYREGMTQIDIHRATGYDTGTIRVALREAGFSDEERKAIYQTRRPDIVPVAQLDPKTGEVLRVFSSSNEAERCFPTGKHISDVCKGRRKTAGGYGWRYIDR